MECPKYVIDVLDTLNRNGFEAYIVGGSVRDFLLGKPCNDYDVATNALPEKVMELFEHCIPTGMKHGTITVLNSKDKVEVTTYRTESQYEDHRHPKNVAFVSSLTEDLKRRDFTVNAMAYHPKEGLVDPFNGQIDLEKKILRCVGNPTDRFQEDALRMMRAHRFVAQLGFTMDTQTKIAIDQNKDLLKYVSVERIHDELTKILKYDPYEIENMVDLLEPWLPELKTSLYCEQNTKWHYCNVLHHCLRAVKELTHFDETKAYSLLLHDLGKPACKQTDENGIDHFCGHPEESARIAKRFVKAFKFTSKQQKEIPMYVLNHENWFYPRLEGVYELRIEKGWSENQVRELLEIRRCDMLAHSIHGQRTNIQILAFKDLYEKCVLTRPMELKDLAINGKDVIEHTDLRGKDIEIALKKCLSYCFYHPYKNKKHILIDFVKNAS